ncbi:MAG TPA: glycerophosphodiester phosphodiesterase [Terriglobales bacterium]
MSPLPHSPLHSPLLLGHRGHRLPLWGESENTLAAFDRALAAGCDGIELDLHATADGAIVIHHDPDLRLQPQPVPIAAASLRALRRLQPQIATLNQVLRRYRRTAWLDLEVKAAPVVELLPALLHRLPPERGFVVSSFEGPVLARLAQLDPTLPLCWNLRRPCSLRKLQAARRWGVTWIAPHHAGCTAWYVRRLRSQGWRVLVWTVNRSAKMRLLARAGADALVSDDPYRLVEIVSRAQTG